MAVVQTDSAERSREGAYHDKGVTWSQTVPRELVHRVALSEVLLTDSVRTGDDRFVVAAQWPRAHTFYGADGNGRHDPMLVAETLRQAGLLVGHRYYGVPTGHQFIMRHLGFTVEVANLQVGPTPSEVTATLACSRVRRSAGGPLRSCELTMQLCRGDEPVARAWATMACVSPGMWGRLQVLPATAEGLLATADAAPAGDRLDAATVGRSCGDDVLLWAVPGAGDDFVVRCDPSHPVLFDHPLDHVPGMAQLEVFRQAARALLCASGLPAGPISRLEATFDRFAPLEVPLRCAATQVSGAEVQLRLRTGAATGGETVSSAVLAW